MPNEELAGRTATKKEKIAILGTGISGMSVAYFLNQLNQSADETFKNRYDIVVYEKNDYIGGHTNTIEIDGVPVDTGFMVFNHVTYPYLTKLFEELDVPYVNTDMSFSVRYDPTKLEYHGSSLSGLFAQRKRIFCPSHIKFLWQIKRFCSQAINDLKIISQERTPEESNHNIAKMNIREYVDYHNLGEDFFNKFLVPMSSAVWSTPEDKMGEFPALTLIRFFYNHGFLGLDTQHQWLTVTRGSETYKQKLIKPFKDRIRTNAKIQSVSQTQNEGTITFQDGTQRVFDKIVFACHADQALALIKNPLPIQTKLLSPFKYQTNEVVVHRDETVMPTLRSCWSSWNYIVRDDMSTYTTYYMNRLQNLGDLGPILINVEGVDSIAKDKIIREFSYEHPLFDVEAIRAQPHLHTLNDKDNPFYFCGAYFKYGFHEDGLASGVNLANQLKQQALGRVLQDHEKVLV